MAIRILSVVVLVALGTTVGAQSVRHYDITIRKLYTAEQQLLYEQKRTIGLHRAEIDRQLREVRKQRMAIERLRTEARSGRRAPVSDALHYTPPPPPRRKTVYRPPQPDWKTIETPHVMVKGTMMVDGQMAALVSGGQIVRSNEVFATTYRGQTRYWRVADIDAQGAQFERVTETGAPLGEPNPASEREPSPPDSAPSVPKPWPVRVFRALLNR